jgi:hypothetical protein
MTADNRAREDAHRRLLEMATAEHDAAQVAYTSHMAACRECADRGVNGSGPCPVGVVKAWELDRARGVVEQAAERRVGDGLRRGSAG